MSVKTEIWTDEFVFFYKGILSQFYPSYFVIKGIRFNRCEQWMMWNKAMYFGDTKTAGEILKSNNPYDQKMLGRSVTPFIEKEWDEACKPIVYEGNWAKYTQNKRLGEFLKSTAGLLLVEASRSDKIWGIGLGMDDSRIYKRYLWVGTNYLGEIETSVRINMFGS